MSYLYLLTKNSDKLASAKSIFNPYGIEVRSLDFDAPEIQASTSVEIARYAVKQAYEQFHQPVIREDHSFFIKELNFPGPFMTYADKAISAEQLLTIINTLSNREAYFELGAAYCDKTGTIHDFSYQVPVVMASELKGSDEFRWERLMMLPGETRTFAEYSDNERTDLWTKNYEAIARLISEKED